MDNIPYFLVFFILCINLLYNTKKSNDLSFFCLFLFGALRYNVGYDFPTYYDIIKNNPEYARFEFIELLLVQFSHNIFYQLFFIINSFITVYCVKWGTEKISSNLSVTALIFLCFPLLYTHSFSIIRFWSAVAIVFYASTLLFRRRWFYSLILMFIALGFHLSAIVGLLFFPIYYINIGKKLNFVILIIGFIGGEFVLGKILGGFLPESAFALALENYAQIGNTGSAMTKIPYFYLSLNILSLLLSNPRKNPVEYKFVTIFNVGVSIMFLFSFDATLSSRLCRPFLLYIILIIPSLLERTRNNINNYKIYLSGTVCLCGLLLFYLINIYNDSIGKSEFLPYQIFLFEN